MRVALLALLLAACGTAVEKSDWEREHEAKLAPDDAAPPLPAYPRERELVEFLVSTPGELRFFIDPASISVGEGVVRYALVARSPTGATNVTFEGIRCRSGEGRVYAVGWDGGWTRSAGRWRESRTAWQEALYRQYFCPQRRPIASAREAIEALRR